MKHRRRIYVIENICVCAALYIGIKVISGARKARHWRRGADNGTSIKETI